MRKIPTLFLRDPADMRRLLREVHPDCGWVVAGEGRPTYKFDGMCCLVRGGKLFKRYELKRGRRPPPNFEAAQEAPDAVTGDLPGWVPVGDGPEDRWFREAFGDGLSERDAACPDWTYELVGPKVQGNPEKFHHHDLVPHGTDIPEAVPTDFDGLREYLAARDIEGIVWWRDPDDLDCPKAKIKKRDFGLSR